MDGSISFDGNSLQTYVRSTQTGVIVDDIDVLAIPQKVINMIALAHSNGSTIPFVNYPSRTITVTGTIVGSSSADLDSRIDTFKGYFNGVDKNLDIGYGSGTRRFTATANLLPLVRSNNNRYATFTLTFVCTNPFGVNTSATVALNATARTAATYSDTYTWLGNSPYQLPVITLTLTAVSSTGSQQMFWGNSDTGQAITITRSTWAASDVVVIDCVNRTVTVNGIATDYIGAFPEFTNASHIMVYGDSFTSRTLTENVSYNVRWL